MLPFRLIVNASLASFHSSRLVLIAAQLRYLDTHLHKLCVGSLPSMWGEEGAFSSLTVLFLTDNPLSGTLPAEWGGNNSWPALQQLELGASSSLSPPSRLSGTFPPEWGSPSAFPQLTKLLIYNTLITGKWENALTAS